MAEVELVDAAKGIYIVSGKDWPGEYLLTSFAHSKAQIEKVIWTFGCSFGTHLRV